MQNYRSKSISLKTKLGMLTGVIVFITVTILTTYFVINSRNEALKATKTQIGLIAQNSALTISKKVDETMNKMQALCDYSKMIRQIQGKKREVLTEFLKNELIDNPSLQGVTLCYAPHMFDQYDSLYAGKTGNYTDGRLAIYWYRENNEITYDTTVLDFEEEINTAGGDWWTIPKSSKSTYMEVTLYTLAEKEILMLSISIPILQNNEFIGVVCFDYQGDFMQKEALTIKEKLFEGKSQITIVSDNGTFAANTVNDSLINKSIHEVNPGKADKILNSIKNENTDFYIENDTLFLSTPIHFAKYDKQWQINISIPKSIIMSQVNGQGVFQLFVGIILIILSVFLIVFIITKLIKPLLDLTQATKVLATGNLMINIENIPDDEIGILAQSFQIMITKLSEIVNGIHQGAMQIAEGSLQVSGCAQIISEGATKQAASTEEVAASIEEVVTAINQNADNAQQVQLIAKKAETGIVESQKASLTTIETMKKIAEKTSIITQIAQQTNILAINAAIEAARAGTLGRGFGIVAAEVRNLAESSNSAAADIVQLAEESLKKSEISGQILSSIVPDVQKTALLIEKIAAASMEQNSGVKQISKAIEQLNSVTIQNSATSEELASSSEELVAHSETLKQAVSFFSLNWSDNQTNKLSPGKNENLTRTKETFPIIKLEASKPKPKFKGGNKGFNINLGSKTDDEFEVF